MTAAAMQLEGGDFYRTMGVPGDAPRFPETPAPDLDAARAECANAARKSIARAAALDLSLEATPAAEDLRNLLTIIEPLGDSLIREAVKRLAKSALEKIERAAAANA